MQKLFCSHCSKPNFFEDVKPLYCSFCQNPFAGTVVANIKIEPTQQNRPSKRVLVPRPVEEGYIEDDDNIDTNINLQFEPPTIELDNIPGRNSVKAENLILDKGPKEHVDRPKLKISKNKKLAEKEVQEMFRSDLSTSKGRSKEIGSNG